MRPYLSSGKINLGLSVGPLREDGFHSLKTLFIRISLFDRLSIGKSDQLNLTCTHPGVPVDGENLLLKAYHAYYRDHSDPPPLRIHLEKKIPIGAGLGGGSSNAAELLKVLYMNELDEINIERLHKIGMNLGSDVPFFLETVPCYAEGRGEILSPIPPLPSLPLILAGTQTHLSTADVYSRFDAIPTSEPGVFPLKEVQQDLHSTGGKNLSSLVRNDLEPIVESHWPEMKVVREKLEESGAHYVSMSGSGFAYYGIYPSVQLRDHALQSLRNNLPFVQPVETI